MPRDADLSSLLAHLASTRIASELRVDEKDIPYTVWVSGKACDLSTSPGMDVQASSCL
jgi:hypothetical protein